MNLNRAASWLSGSQKKILRASLGSSLRPSRPPPPKPGFRLCKTPACGGSDGSPRAPGSRASASPHFLVAARVPRRKPLAGRIRSLGLLCLPCLGLGFRVLPSSFTWALILASLCSAPRLPLLACKFTSSSSCGVKGAACAALTCRVEGNRLRELGW